jgi:hypothetical protein
VIVHVRLTILGLTSLALSAVGSSGQPASTSWPLTIEPIASPAAPDSAQPQFSVSGKGAILSWVERAGAGATLKFAERTPSGWSQAAAVASGDDWFVNWADVPSVVRLADGTLAAHWLQKSGADTYAYDVRLSLSKDNGRTWGDSFKPHDDGTKTEHGFASLFQMPGAGLGLVWLDGRDMKADKSGHASGNMALRFAAYDSAGTRIADQVVDARVCECCPTSAVVTSTGPLVAYRDNGAEDVRDIQLSRRENGTWSAPAPVHRDEWKIPACPVNGPALSAQGSDVAIAWFTAKGDQPHAFVAFSSDAGRSFGAPIRLDDASSLGRVDVELLPDGSAAASYIEFTEQRAQFRIRRVERSGARSDALTVSAIDGGRTSGYPRLARDGNQLLFAWIEREATPRVRTAAGRLINR